MIEFTIQIKENKDNIACIEFFPASSSNASKTEIDIANEVSYFFEWFLNKNLSSSENSVMAITDTKEQMKNAKRLFGIKNEY